MSTEKFPHYTGYGLAQKTSYRKEGNIEIMDYYLDDVKVHEIKLSADRAWFTDYVDNRPCTETTYPTLKQTVFSHFVLANQLENPIQSVLAKKVCNTGNVYYTYLGKEQVLYYPAVYLLSLKIPVTSANRVAVDYLKEQHLTRTLHKTEYASYITVTPRHGDVYQEDISILDILLPLSFAYWVVTEAAICQAILPDKLHRALLSPKAANLSEHMQMFRGTDDDDWLAYNIFYKN